MLFAEPFNLKNILPWVVIALAAIMLGGILAKCISIYRNIKKNRTYVKKNDEPKTPLLTIRGEYFVLSSSGTYSVGEGGQIKQGNYLVRGDGYDKFQLVTNGETKDFEGDIDVKFADGDVINPVCDVLVKPIVTNEEQI